MEATNTIKLLNQDFVRLDRFDGTNFTRWQDKMKFMLTALKIFYMLDPNLQPIPDPTDDDTDEIKAEQKKRNEDEVMCRGHILNALSDRLYDLYTVEPSAKAIWNALEFKYHAEEEDTTGQLLRGINDYRVSLNLSSLTENENADCLAAQLASAFKGQDCSNTTGSDTVPGTEEQFPDFPDYLTACHLNATVTRDGFIMPACVPDLAPDLVLANYTKSQYNQKLNDSSYAGIGIAEEGNWVVVVLTTNTATGNYASAADASAGSFISVADHNYVMLLLLGFAIYLVG